MFHQSHLFPLSFLFLRLLPIVHSSTPTPFHQDTPIGPRPQQGFCTATLLPNQFRGRRRHTISPKKTFFLVPSRLFGSGPTTSFFSPDPTSASQRAKCAAETLVAPIWASHGGRRGFRHRSLCGCVSASPSHHTGHSRRGASKYCARRSTFPMLFALRSPPGLDWSG